MSRLPQATWNWDYNEPQQGTHVSSVTSKRRKLALKISTARSYNSRSYLSTQPSSGDTSYSDIVVLVVVPEILNWTSRHSVPTNIALKRQIERFHSSVNPTKTKSLRTI